MFVIGTSGPVSFPIYAGPQSLLIAAMLRILESSRKAIPKDTTPQQNISQRERYHVWKPPCSKTARDLRRMLYGLLHSGQLPIAIVEVEAVAQKTGGLLGFRTLFTHGGRVTVNNGRVRLSGRGAVHCFALYMHVCTSR